MKKFIISSILLSIIIMSSYSVFAAKSNTGNIMANVGDSMQNVTEGARNTVGSIENGIENGAMSVKNTIMGTTNTMENGAENMTNYVSNNNYTAQRTAGETTVLGMTTNTWTWLIIAIVGIAIIALVWYYGAQYEHKNYDNE